MKSKGLSLRADGSEQSSHLLVSRMGDGYGGLHSGLNTGAIVKSQQVDHLLGGLIPFSLPLSLIDHLFPGVILPVPLSYHPRFDAGISLGKQGRATYRWETPDATLLYLNQMILSISVFLPLLHKSDLVP